MKSSRAGFVLRGRFLLIIILMEKERGRHKKEATLPKCKASVCKLTPIGLFFQYH